MAKYLGFSLAEVNDPTNRAFVKSRSVATPPAHVAGDAYLIPTGATGEWSTHVDHIAWSDGVAWVYQASPPAGLELWVEDDVVDVIFDGANWDLVVAVNSNSIAITRGTDPYFSTKSGIYELVVDRSFPGTDEAGSPSAVIATAWVDSGATMSIRIFDVTNSLVVAEVTGLTAPTSKGPVNLGALSNLPTGPATMELQILKSAGGGALSVFVSFLDVIF